MREAIEILEQEPCGDAISRQAALDKKELIELEDGQFFYCISPEDIETLPSVNPQPKTDWFSVSERLQKMLGVPKEKLDEYEDLYRYFMKKNFGIDESEEEK